MPRYRHVLVAFDDSPEGELTLAHAVAMAHHYRARLTIVAVAPPRAWPSRGPDGELQQRLRAAADKVPDDLAATTRLLEGDAAGELLREGREHDVIVIAAGRVADAVTQDADVPVIVVHRPNDGPDLAA